MKIHELKIDPEYFDSVVCGDKTSEVRRNDRDFRVGDAIQLTKGQYGSESFGSFFQGGGGD